MLRQNLYVAPITQNSKTVAHLRGSKRALASRSGLKFVKSKTDAVCIVLKKQRITVTIDVKNVFYVFLFMSRFLRF